MKDSRKILILNIPREIIFSYLYFASTITTHEDDDGMAWRGMAKGKFYSVDSALGNVQVGEIGMRLQV